jgi:hypothetical protein
VQQYKNVLIEIILTYSSTFLKSLMLSLKEYT